MGSVEVSGIKQINISKVSVDPEDAKAHAVMTTESEARKAKMLDRLRRQRNLGQSKLGRFLLGAQKLSGLYSDVISGRETSEALKTTADNAINQAKLGDPDCQVDSRVTHLPVSASVQVDSPEPNGVEIFCEREDCCKIGISVASKLVSRDVVFSVAAQEKAIANPGIETAEVAPAIQ
jgi:hypothetical protein